LADQKVLHQPDEVPVWEDIKGWPGGFIESVRLVAAPDRRPGKGMVWITNDIEMVADEPTDDLVHLLGMVDTANGVVPRLGIELSAAQWKFPNTD
ncbi:thioesterase family protein, partial [Psychrobacter sp. FBL11]